MSEDIGPNDSPDPQDCGWVSGAAYSKKLAEAQADCAAKGLALQGMLNTYEELHAKYNLGDCDATVAARAALASNAGDALVKELERLRAENAAWKEYYIAGVLLDETDIYSPSHQEAVARVVRAAEALTPMADGTLARSIQEHREWTERETAKRISVTADLRAQRDQAVLLAMDTLEQWRCGVGCHNGKVLTYAGDERSRYRTCPTCNGNGLHPKATAALAKLAALSPPPSDDTLKV